jgi:hypothetical protein
MGTKQAWDRLPGEPDKAWAAFCSYRDMPVSGRSIKAAQELQTGKKLKTRQPSRHWLSWSSKWNWVARARACDAHRELQNRDLIEAQHRDKLQDHLDQQQRVARANVEASVRLLDLANARLKGVEADLKKKPKVTEIPRDVVAAIRVAAQAGDAASAARSEALGVEELLAMLDEGVA